MRPTCPHEGERRVVAREQRGCHVARAVDTTIGQRGNLILQRRTQLFDRLHEFRATSHAGLSKPLDLFHARLGRFQLLKYLELSILAVAQTLSHVGQLALNGGQLARTGRGRAERVIEVSRAQTKKSL